MRKLTADFIFTGQGEPLKNTVVEIDNGGKILSVSSKNETGDSGLEYFPGALCPGLINAHCHLELSYMRGKVPRGNGLAQFIIDLLSIRNAPMEEVRDAIEKAEAEMIRNGIVAVGDISNDDHTIEQKSKHQIEYHTFVEAYGFKKENAAQHFEEAKRVFHLLRKCNLRASITPHAPYSVPPELFDLIFSYDENSPAVFSIHNQETQAETDFFRDGSGDFNRVLEFFKLDHSVFTPTGKSSLASVLPFIHTNRKLLLVHNTKTTNEYIDAAQATHSNLWWCFCPKANLYIENQLPDFASFKKLGDRLLLGTDSLASNDSLSILDEMKTIRKHHPQIPTRALIRFATANAAEFFEWNDLGEFSIGKTPGINYLSNISAEGEITPDTEVQKII